MYEYRVKIRRVVDGDTVDVDIDLGFGVWLNNERVRLAGIDAPESRTKDLIEKQFGLYAKDYVRRLLPEGSERILVTSSYDPSGKFGRILGDFKVAVEGRHEYDLLTSQMIRDNVAVPYSGNSKEEIEALHLENRMILVENGMVKI